MKICWGNLEGFYLTKRGNFKRPGEGNTYYEHDMCVVCGDPFLGAKDAEHCTQKCTVKTRICSEETKKKISERATGRRASEETKKKLSIAGTKRKHTDETKKKMSESKMGHKTSEETKQKIKDSLPDMSGENNPMYDKKHTEEAKKKISEKATGRGHTEEAKKKISIAFSGENHPLYGKYGKNSPNWDGGYSSNNIPKYDLYAHQLEPYEECRRQEKDPNILEVKCTLCRTWFIPIVGEVYRRIAGLDTDQGKFYCSDPCKQICPLYKRTIEQLVKQDAIRSGKIPLKELRNEVPAWIRDKVLELDDHTCQMCGSKDKLHVHHEIPQKRNQMLALDIENCVSVCIPCHVWVHTQIDGCRYHELANLELC